MPTTTKSLSNVKLRVNYNSIDLSNDMSNISSGDNISDTLAKVQHWYAKTNGFQPPNSDDDINAILEYCNGSDSYITQLETINTTIESILDGTPLQSNNQEEE